MIALFLFLLCVCLFVFSFLYFKNIWHPSVLIFIPWTFVFLGLFICRDDFVEYKEYPFLVIFSGIVSMSLGGILFPNYNLKIMNIRSIKPKCVGVTFIFLILVFLCYFPFFFIDRLNFIIGEMTYSAFRTASLNAGSGVVNRIMQVFLIIIALIWHNRVKDKKHAKFLALALFSYFCYMITMGNKAYFIQLIIFISCLLFTSSQLNIVNRSKHLFLIILLIVVVLWAMSFFRDGSSNILNQIKIYLLSGVIIFQELMSAIPTDQWIVPMGQLGSILTFIENLKLNSQSSDLPFTFVGEELFGNTATVFFYFYHAGGIIGVCFFSFLTGMIHTYFFILAIKGSLSSYFIYLYLNSYLFITFFDLGFISMPFSVIFFIIAVKIFVDLRLMSKKISISVSDKKL